MDWLIEHKESLERRFTEGVLGLFDQDLKVVFYDCTSVYFQIRRGDEDFRRYGCSRDKRKDLPQVVADRGMLSDANLEELADEGFGFLMSLNMKGNAAFQDQVSRIKSELEAKWEEESKSWDYPDGGRDVYYDGEIESRRLVVAYNPKCAEHSLKLRERIIAAADREIDAWINKLNSQDDGKKARGRKVTDQGVFLKAHDLLKKKGIQSYCKIFLDDEGLFRCHVNRKARNRAGRLDGILTVITTGKELSAKGVIEQYKGLQDVKRCFRTLKSSLDIRPVRHWTEKRIRAHIFLCVMALQVQRSMRAQLKAARSAFSPESALRRLSTIHAIKAGDRLGMTSIREDHKAFFR